MRNMSSKASLRQYVCPFWNHMEGLMEIVDGFVGGGDDRREIPDVNGGIAGIPR